MRRRAQLALRTQPGRGLQRRRRAPTSPGGRAQGPAALAPPRWSVVAASGGSTGDLGFLLKGWQPDGQLRDPPDRSGREVRRSDVPEAQVATRDNPSTPLATR